MVGSNAERWQWAEELPSDELGFARYNVMAVFPTLTTAEAAAADLRTAGVSEGQMSIRTRTMTDDPAAPRVAPAVEAPTRGRDAQVAGRVFTRVVMMAAAVGAGAALAAFLITLAIGLSGTMIAIITVVAAVAGAVAGAAWGGAVGSMTEAQKEEGVVLWVRCDDEGTAGQALRTLRGRRPLRIDSYDAQGKLIRLS